MSSASTWAALLVSLTVLAAFLGKIVQLGYRQVRNHEKSQEQLEALTRAVQELLTKVTGANGRIDQIERTLNNGLRDEVRTAGSNAKEAITIGQENGRELRALRAEVDIYTNAVVEDRRRIRAIVKEATGIDIADA